MSGAVCLGGAGDARGARGRRRNLLDAGATRKASARPRRSGQRGRSGRRAIPHRLHFHIPRNLNVRDLLLPHLRPYADCLNYFLHLIVTAQLLWEADEDGYVRLKQEYLRRVIPKLMFHELVLWAQQNLIIRWDRNFEIGAKSMGYKLTDAYMTAGFHRVPCVSANVAAKVLKLRQTLFYTDVKLPVLKHLRMWYSRLTVDTEAARETVLNDPDLALSAPLHMATIDMLDAIAVTPLDRLEFSVCTKGRVHTIATRLAKPLRQHLRINGEPLVNADIANSQPLLLGLVVLQFRTNKAFTRDVKNFDRHTTNPYRTKRSHTPATEPPQRNGNRKRARRDPGPRPEPKPTPTPGPGAGPREPGQAAPGATNTMSIWCPESLETDSAKEFTRNRSALSDDERRYIEICEDGRIYEYMIDRLKGVGLTVTRDDIKPEFYRLYYGPARPVSSFRSEVSRAFARLFAADFPGIVQVVNAVKKQAGYYEYLVRKMQNVESTLVIGTICERLMREHPDIPLLTIHDSIATTAAHAPLVRRVMVEELLRAGLRPMIKPEAWARLRVERLSA
jgi:hypothetical protein